MNRWVIAIVIALSVIGVTGVSWLVRQQVLYQEARDAFFAPIDLSGPRNYATMEPRWDPEPEVGDAPLQ